ncbi:protein-glutamine gamma-glutamyltransferase [Paenibacillus tarimensis]
MRIVIEVAGMSVIDASSFTGMERFILMRKDRSSIVYRYESFSQLRFELDLRINLMNAAQALSRSGATFSTFKQSRCNPLYWNRTENGGFSLKREVRPSAAIRDIFTNGFLYAFECATAMVIVLYKAVLDSIGEQSFNRFYSDLLLYDWNYDKDLRLITIKNNYVSDPGDILYFINPDVNPQTPEWQGLNVVMLGDNLYFGHGMGIGTGEKIIAGLNAVRRPNSTQSAYLLDQATFPDFKYIYRLSTGVGGGLDDYGSIQRFNPKLVTAKIGALGYVEA